MDTASNSGDQETTWSCKMCTFQNSPERFKCEMCFFERGRSTRKPRVNMGQIMAQVVKQQEQIRQQTSTKKPKKRARMSNSETKSSSTNQIKSSPEPTTSLLADNQDDNTQDYCTPDYSNHEDEIDEEDSSQEVPSSLKNGRILHDSIQDDSNQEDNSVQDDNIIDDDSTPIRVEGKLIKYTPPISIGRAGLIIDKKRFTQHSVTVNDITITFTEFATRQNTYIRKKKKKRSMIGR